MEKTSDEIEEAYELEFDRIARIVKEKRAKRILIQLPDGLKPYATRIAEKIENLTKANVIIWGGSCYGPCDIPDANELKFDIIFHFGHAEVKFNELKEE